MDDSAHLERIAYELADTPYRPVRRIGRGGMAEVLEVEHAHLGTRMALKVLLPKVCRDELVRDRFRTEARAQTRIFHENLLRVTDLGETRAGRPFLICELLAGENLSDRIKRDGPLSPEMAVDFAVQALAGLSVAHERGIVHRDVKPANLFVCEPDERGKSRVKVLDFGIAKVVDTPGKATPSLAPRVVTQEGRMIGTPSFVSPEQATAKPVDARADLYAMGCCLYFALTGERVFPSDNLAELLYAHVMQAPEPPSKRAAHPVPPALDAAILRALMKKPADRFADAVEMAEALRASLAPDAFGAPATDPLPDAETAPSETPGAAADSLPVATPTMELAEIEQPALRSPPADREPAGEAAPNAEPKSATAHPRGRPTARPASTKGKRTRAALEAAAIYALTALVAALLAWGALRRLGVVP